jgi:hypothetical protein
MSGCQAQVRVEAGQAQAFARFTDGLGDWWPREYTWSQDRLEAMGSEMGWPYILERYRSMT